MGYILLILGIAIWIGAHIFKRVAPDRRAAMGDAGKALVAVLLLGSYRPDGHRLPQRGGRAGLVPRRPSRSISRIC